MSALTNLSIKSRLILMLLSVSLASILIVGFLALRTAERALQQSIENQLTSIRSIKADQMETYYSSLLSVTRTLGASVLVTDAVERLTLAYDEGLSQTLTPEQQQQLTDYYAQEYLPQLAENMDELPVSALYEPTAQAASYFQYHYIASNPLPPERKYELFVAEEDTTSYRELHEENHPAFLSIRDEFDFNDLYLIDLRSGNIVYSILKAPDFATSLYDGPYRDSGLGVLAARIRDVPERGSVQVIDYRPYPPALDAPTAFIGIPLFSAENAAVGILALQLPVDDINNVMTGGGTWQEDGLGQTGESYLVGRDLRMRSVSRFYLEDKEGYLQAAQAAGIPAETIEAMRRHSTILLQPVDTEAARRALDSETGTDILKDYRGVEVLSSYAPLDLGGPPWAIISEIDATEAFTPIRNLQRTLLIWSVGLMLTVAFLAIALAQFFVRPIDKLASAAQQIAAGRDDVHVNIASKDEFGDLAVSFNGMVASIRAQKAAIADKNAENERLLLNILPAPIAERLRAGERIADQLQQVSVIFIHMLGFTQLSEQRTATESAALLEQMIDMLDEAAARHDVERVKIVGETYIAACGLTTARLDHASQSIDFAVEALTISQRLGQEQQQQIALQIGINAGPVVSGVVGSARFNFELWGETVEIASRLHTQAKPNGLLITEAVYQRIDGKALFQPRASIASSGAEVAVYEYGTLAAETGSASTARGERA